MAPQWGRPNIVVHGRGRSTRYWDLPHTSGECAARCSFQRTDHGGHRYEFGFGGRGRTRSPRDGGSHAPPRGGVSTLGPRCHGRLRRHRATHRRVVRAGGHLETESSPGGHERAVTCDVNRTTSHSPGGHPGG